VHDLRDRSVTPHIAIDGHLSKTGKRRKTAVDARTTRHAGCDISQRCRKRIEEVFGWIKGSAGLAKIKLRGRARVDAAFTLALAAYTSSAYPSCWRPRMSIRGKWRIFRMPDYEADFPMMGPACILFGKAAGEFAFGCVTGAIHGTAKGDAVEFTWSGNDEMEEACGDGWAELQPDGTLEGQICIQGGDQVDFTAKPWRISSTTC
jgi:Transposase DDE domain